MIRTFALTAMAALGMMLMSGQSGPAAAGPTIASKIAAPDSVVERACYRRGHRGGRVHVYRGPRYVYGRTYRRGVYYYPRYRYAYPRYYRYRHARYYRPGIVIGAGLPFFYSGYGYYGGCGHYYRKWKYTGSRYWRNRYYACRWW